MLALMLLVALGGGGAAADDVPAPRAFPGLPGLPGGAAPAGPQVPAVVEWEAQVTITAGLLDGMMRDELALNRPYLEAVGAQQGQEAARQAEEALVAPYLQRIAEIQAGAQATQSIPMVTLYGIWTFSKTSHRGAYLSPSDPVSILFYWDGTKSGVYNRMDSIHTCWPDEGTCNHFPEYQDEDARSDIPFVSCSTSAQWVYMGNVGGTLYWKQGQYGLMKEDDACNVQPRDHMRIFGSVYHSTYRYWSVATPHHETWGPGGHTPDSWESAKQLFAGSWVESGLPNDKRGWDTSVFWWSLTQWGNGGTYQEVYFNGNGFVIGTDR